MSLCQWFASGIWCPGAVSSGREPFRWSPDAAVGRWLPQDDARCALGEVSSSPPSDTSDDVNESLGRKIAGLDLSEAEAAALVVAFGGRVEAEVSGFVLGLGELQECAISKPLLGQMRSAEWFVADRFIFYEDEMGSQRR